VCNGLRKRRPLKVIAELQKVKNSNNMFSLIDPECLEDVDSLKKYVLAHNEKLATLRINLYLRAMQVQQMDDMECWNFKVKMF